jgi:hypothetical protein
MEHTRRSERVADVLERHEVGAPFRASVQSRYGRHASKNARHVFGAMHPEPVVMPAIRKSFRCTIAGRSPIPLRMRVESTRQEQRQDSVGF